MITLDIDIAYPRREDYIEDLAGLNEIWEENKKDSGEAYDGMIQYLQELSNEINERWN